MSASGEKRRTLLLLGGSQQQVVAIETANRLGYRTVVCDYLPDNPGQHHADKYYLVSTTDKDAVLDIARKEQIDGVVAYASDPAAPTAAYVSEKLGLPGMPYSTAKVFCEKHLFRKFLQERGFNVPKALSVNVDKICQKQCLDGFSYPLIIKPSDSSGSKGVSVVNNYEEIVAALEKAVPYSRNGVLVIEEFIQRRHKHVIEAELFIKNGEVSSWGLINSIRDADSNPLLPAGYSYPLALPEEDVALVKDEVSNLIKASGCNNGAFNIEMIIDSHNQLYFLDAGPRNGGNMLPDFISLISGKDTIEATVRAAVDELDDFDVNLNGREGGYWGLGVLHSAKQGIFQDIEYSHAAKLALRRDYIQKKRGEKAAKFEKCSDLVGLAFFEFTSLEEQESIMNNMNESMKVRTS